MLHQLSVHQHNTLAAHNMQSQTEQYCITQCSGGHDARTKPRCQVAPTQGDARQAKGRMEMAAAAWTGVPGEGRGKILLPTVYMLKHTRAGVRKTATPHPLPAQRRTAADTQGAQNRRNIPWYNDATAQATDLNRKPLKLCRKTRLLHRHETYFTSCSQWMP
jgi:hypothetical protein